MELLQVADNVAREKNIDREIVIVAMEEAIQKAGRSKYGHEQDIRAQINRDSGIIELKRYREVMEDGVEIENEVAQLTLEQAKKIILGTVDKKAKLINTSRSEGVVNTKRALTALRYFSGKNLITSLYKSYIAIPDQKDNIKVNPSSLLKDKFQSINLPLIEPF